VQRIRHHERLKVRANHIPRTTVAQRRKGLRQENWLSRLELRFRFNSAEVIEVLGESKLEHGVPDHIRSENGAEM
jgi:hypothetical protein